MGPLDIFDWISTFRSVWDHGDASAEGDPWGFAGLGGDGVGIAAELLPKAYETPVIAAGLSAIAAMGWMCGFGDSEKGDSFGDGGSKFNEINDKLKSASPDGGWTGSASDAYAIQNDQQQRRATTMVDADFDMNQIISCEANQLSGTRDILDHAGTILGYAILPAIAAMRIPVIGWEISMGIQLGAVGGTVPVCQAEMIQMAARALENAESVRKAIDLYNSANPDPNLRTHEVGLWGSPRSGSTEQSPDGSPGEAAPVNSQAPNSAPSIPPSPAPHAPSNPAPTVPSRPAPTTPSSPAPTAPSSPAPTVPSSSGSSPQTSAPPAPPVPSAPGSPGIAGGGAPISTGAASTGLGSAPTSLSSQAGQQAAQFAAKPSAPQAASGSANAERAPVRFETQTEGEAQSASTRTGEDDVR